MSETFSDMDGQGHGVHMEVAPAHPGLWAFGLPWTSGRQHRRMMQDLKYTANNLLITRDRYGGEVRLDKSGQPMLHYKVHAYDRKHMMRGVTRIAKNPPSSRGEANLCTT